MVQINVYDLNWNYLRCFWTNQMAYGIGTVGGIRKVGNAFYKRMD